MDKTDVTDILEHSAIWLQVLHDMIDANDDPENRKELADLIRKLIYISRREED